MEVVTTAAAAEAEGGGGGSGGAAVEPAAAAVLAQSFQVDEIYEFSAPRFFDFSNEETAEQIKRSELWFETALSHAQSPFVNGVKGGRSYNQESICCNFGHVEDQRLSSSSEKKPEPGAEKSQGDDDTKGIPVAETKNAGDVQAAVLPTGGSETSKEEEKKSDDEGNEEEQQHVPGPNPPEHLGKLPDGDSSTVDASRDRDGTCSTNLAPVQSESKVAAPQASAARTPAISRNAGKEDAEAGSRNRTTARKIASLIRNPSALKPRIQPASTQKHASFRCPGGDIAQENQAVKRQKLDGGLSRQIHNVKSRALVHKSRPDLPADGGDLLSSRDLHGVNRKEDMQAAIQRRPRLTLTRPKEPELETAHRVRAVRIKSSAELEEEMLSKMPKFKARPVNKKILEAPSLPAPQRSAPQPPEFQEFNLKTMERAARNAGASSVASLSMESSTSFNDHFKINRLTEPKPPHLETSLRARPPRVKSSQELELEELERIPKFKARPLDKKIFEMRGDRGLLRRSKRQITIPQEFHFATDERMGPPAFVLEAFDKLSLHSERQSEQRQVPRLTIPNPFHLHTEERGLEKERDFSLQIMHKEIEQERARVPKANPYPYTTDYPVVPPKPAPKECTKPEAFQLESLIRHEEVMQKKMEELEKKEREEAEKRLFRAQPILENRDPFPIAKKERKPLTEVLGFALHVDHRATERAEFDKKIKEKETMYKRMRDEYEVAKKVEEEREVKQMRKTMVPSARPLPNFANPFLPQKSTKEITKPRSPALKVAQRLMRRQQQLLNSHSTSLSQMR